MRTHPRFAILLLLAVLAPWAGVPAGAAAPPSPGAALPESAPADEPFGLRPGMTLEQLGAATLVETAPGTFVLPRVPVPHPGFERVLATIGPESGLCAVAASSSAPDEAAPALPRTAWERLRRQLDARWGASVAAETPARAREQGSADALLTLLEIGEEIRARWSAGAGATLPAGLRSVDLVARVAAAKPEIVLVYVWENHDRCQREISARSPARSGQLPPDRDPESGKGGHPGASRGR